MDNIYVAQIKNTDDYVFIYPDSVLDGNPYWLVTDLKTLKNDIIQFVKNKDIDNIRFLNLCSDLKKIFSEDVKGELIDVDDKFLKNLERLIL